MAYKNHTKFIYKDYDEIQDAINNDEIDIYDIVFTKDTKEIILVTDNYALHTMKSRVYRFHTVAQAESELNKRTDTYEGQIVAIINGASYTGYIVNKNRTGRYYVTALNGFDGVINYNSLGDRPIENAYGTLDRPITIADLDTGVYKISGQYYFSSEDPVTHLSAASNLFLVEHDSDTGDAIIKRITPYSIYDYHIYPDGSIASTEVATEQWIKEQGYASNEDLDKKIEALNLITKSEIADYVAEVIEQSFERVIDEKVDSAIDRTMIPISNDEIRNVVRTTDRSN